MKRLVQLPILILCLMFIAGCATMAWTRVDTAATADPSGNFTVDLPVGWVRLNAQRDAITLTRDGMGIQYITARRRSHKAAFSNLKKSVAPDILPTELAELAIAEMKSSQGLAEYNVLTNAPTTISGHTGFRLHMRLKVPSGLTYDGVVYGFVDEDGFYYIEFWAARLHYFDRDLANFERVVASFRLT
ncbi:MAG: hypothetical protein OEQ39_12355 [Gammaproteobacteria bacterium]|nr:hypothetical protein [Gammaproteobacteria bacterium]MDH3467671.1 hypothetical protein [Gammaproteobacteria bacterium]